MVFDEERFVEWSRYESGDISRKDVEVIADRYIHRNSAVPGDFQDAH